MYIFWLLGKNPVGPDGRGKSQNQDFIDELHGLCRHIPDRMPCWSFLLISVLQIVDSQPLWILLSVLGELC